MSEFLLHGHATVTMHHEIGAPACMLEQWIEKLQTLEESALVDLAPVLETRDAVETLRKAISMSPALANPGRAFAARFQGTCDEVMVFAFQLYQLAAYLRTPRHPPRDRNILTLDGWCRRRLESAAAQHEDLAEKLSMWCVDMIARFDPKFAAWLQNIVHQGRADET